MCRSRRRCTVQGSTGTNHQTPMTCSRRNDRHGWPNDGRFPSPYASEWRILGLSKGCSDGREDRSGAATFAGRGPSRKRGGRFASWPASAGSGRAPSGSTCNATCCPARHSRPQPRDTTARNFCGSSRSGGCAPPRSSSWRRSGHACRPSRRPSWKLLRRRICQPARSRMLWASRLHRHPLR